MIYLYYGDNNAKRQSAVEKQIALHLKKENAAFVSMNDVDADPKILNEYVSSVSLFQTKYVIVLERTLENDEMSQYVFSHLQELADTEHVIIFSERNLTKEVVTKYKKYVEDMEVFELAVLKIGKKEWNVFSLTDAFGSRDKKESWVILQKAWRNGKSPEELHGILFWQVKNMLLVKKSKEGSAVALGLNPFVHKKAEMAAKKFTELELEHISSELTGLLYESRAKGTDVQIAVEQFVLNSL